MPVPPWEWRMAGLVPKFGGERPWTYGAATPAAAATPEEMRIRVHLAADAGTTPGYSTAPDTSLLPQWELGRALRTWRFRVIDNLLNLLFRCAHRRLTRPVAPITKAGQPHS